MADDLAGNITIRKNLSAQQGNFSALLTAAAGIVINGNGTLNGKNLATTDLLCILSLGQMSYMANPTNTNGWYLLNGQTFVKGQKYDDPFTTLKGWGYPVDWNTVWQLPNLPAGVSPVTTDHPEIYKCIKQLCIY